MASPSIEKLAWPMAQTWLLAQAWLLAWVYSSIRVGGLPRRVSKSVQALRVVLK